MKILICANFIDIYLTRSNQRLSMIKINKHLYSIANHVYYRRSSNEKELEYMIYMDKLANKVKGMAAQIWEQLIISSVYFADDETTKDYVEHYKEKGWIIEYGNKAIKYRKMPYLIMRAIEDKFYMINTLFGTATQITQEIYETLIKNEFSNLDQRIVDELLKQSTLTVLDCPSVYQDLWVEDSYYSVYIIFSYNCNMSCVYCFEGNKKISNMMTDMTLELTLKYIDYLAHQKRVEIVFYGGEPLLENNREKILKVMDYYENNKRIYFRFITNGLNIPKYVDAFEKSRDKITRFVITIDGEEATHNLKRIRPDQSGTYQDIICSIRMLTNQNYHVTIRMNIDHESIHNIKNSILEIQQLLEQKDNIDINIHVIHYRYNAEFKEPSVLDLYQLSQEIKEISEVPVSFSHPFLQFCDVTWHEKKGYPHVNDGRCMYNNSRIIDYNGDIYKCSEAMKEKELCIGNVTYIQQIREDMKCIECKKNNECKQCDYYLICYGKCSIQNYIDGLKNGCICDMNHISEALDQFICENTKENQLIIK